MGRVFAEFPDNGATAQSAAESVTDGEADVWVVGRGFPPPNAGSQ